ncbi:MAG: hypothetical protein ACI4AA_00180 [Lachnospiraceae bacterium]
MIRTSTVQLTVIPAIAYRQKLFSGGSGITILRYEVEQPGIASISKTSGEAILSANTSMEIYPLEAFHEAIALTSGMPYKKRNAVRITQEIVIEIEEPTGESEELKEIEVIVESQEYQRIVDLYTDKTGVLSYDLLNRDFIQTAHSSGQVRLMIEDRASADDIRLQIVKARLRNITRNPTLTDAQVLKMIDLLDEVSPKGVFRPLNDEIRKWLRAEKVQ